MSVLKYLCFVAHCHPAHPNNVGMSSWLITDAIMEGRKEKFLFNNALRARCSSVVRAFAHGVMDRRIDPS